MKEVAMVCALILTVSTQAASGQSSSGNAVPVTVENFIRAEFDMYLSAVALKGMVSENSSTTANCRRSTPRPSSG